MRKSDLIIIASTITFLFFIQMAGTLVESIYILNLLNTALDEKVLGLLFFFSPILLVFSHRKTPRRLIAWASFLLLFLSRGITPYLNTNGRLLASGIGTAAALILFPTLLMSTPKNRETLTSAFGVSAGLALGVGLSVMLRTVYFSIDYSMTAIGSWVGWVLGFLLGIALSQLGWKRENPSGDQPKNRVTLAVLGLFLVLTLIYFVFSAPAVLSRWTGWNYPLIISITSLMTLGWISMFLRRLEWINKISPRFLLAWNGLFTLSLLATILVHRVSFPATPESIPVVIGPPTMIQQIPTLLTLLLYPVIFMDFRIFITTIQQAEPTPRELIPGMMYGNLCFILLVFMMIFTNVWGYVEPISPFFRNKFWLPFALTTIPLTLLGIIFAHNNVLSSPQDGKRYQTIWMFILGGIFLLTIGFALTTTRVTSDEPNADSLLVMTYNIQAANDRKGEKSYEQQLKLIRQVSPDILALQESDTARISLNNNDYVRYFAGKLGYYSYYGPTTVTGTFGTAILSRFPLQNNHTIFSYSDQDEIGTTVAMIGAGGHNFTIYNVHPDGSDTAMLAFARMLLSYTEGKDGVVALGDYNLRENEKAYQMIDAVFINAWISVYPTGVSEDGVDMSGTGRIDHIFLSPDLRAGSPIYLLEPESHTDHPAHWTEVFWLE